MITSTLVQAALVGMLVTGGLVALLRACVAPAPRLSDALAHLDGSTPGEPADTLVATDRSEAFGIWVYRTLRLPLTARQRAALSLRGTSISEFMAEKCVWAVLGVFTVSLLGFMLNVLVHVGFAMPALVGLVAGVGCFFVPDLRLATSSAQVHEDADEALFTFFDLVTLERLANLSGPQAMSSAAALSDHALFLRIRGALERARLEQRPPYGELKRLAAELELEELNDIADVMSLEETGAALSTALRARVRELRDGQLTRHKVAAHALSERMTVYMVIPAMVFALIFLTPPLLRIAGLG